jgi:hypothetical protein
VQVGPTCVDKYEASVWDVPFYNHALIGDIKRGTATLEDLIAGGARQVSPCLPDFPESFPATGNWTAPLYAVSIPGVLPASCVSWFQAVQACALSGKRLLTNQEWQQAAAGTPDTGIDNLDTDCAVGVIKTGSRSSCVSRWGAFDMIGNVWEWVADWGPLTGFCSAPLTAEPRSETFPCVLGTDSGVPTGAGTLPGPLVRGGLDLVSAMPRDHFLVGDVEGYINAYGKTFSGNTWLDDKRGYLGFRCAR